jgi:hypothetical protein
VTGREGLKEGKRGLRNRGERRKSISERVQKEKERKVRGT